jgi:hypothetical protein
MDIMVNASRMKETAYGLLKEDIYQRNLNGATIVKNYLDFVDDHTLKPESKFDDKNGQPCGQETQGLLFRKHVDATKIIHVGKQIKTEDADIIPHDIDERVMHYNIHKPKPVGKTDGKWISMKNMIMPEIQNIITKEFGGKIFYLETPEIKELMKSHHEITDKDFKSEKKQLLRKGLKITVRAEYDSEPFQIDIKELLKFNIWKRKGRYKPIIKIITSNDDMFFVFKTDGNNELIMRLGLLPFPEILFNYEKSSLISKFNRKTKKETGHASQWRFFNDEQSLELSNLWLTPKQVAFHYDVDYQQVKNDFMNDFNFKLYEKIYGYNAYKKYSGCN